MALIRQADAGRIAREAIVLDLGDVQRQAAQLMEQARRRAREIVAEAQAERERILVGAAEQGRAEGHRKGAEEGRRAGAAEGRAAALTEWKKKLEQLDARWSESLRRFEAERDRMYTEARLDVLRLGVRMAEKVVKRVIEIDPNVVGVQLEAVLALIARPSELLVAVNPEDRECAQAALPGLMGLFQSVRHVELLDDPALPRGSCVARTRAAADGASAGGGEIDASIDEQLRRIAELLLPAVGVSREGEAS